MADDLPGHTASERALAAAPWMPDLRLRAVVAKDLLPGRSRLDTVIYGELVWPLGRTPVGDNVAAARDRRQRSAERSALVARIAAAWHARTIAEDAADDVAARLAEEEADAELDAITGDDEGAR